ncbi:MAG: ATP-grasp domain-containing protein, partial [Chloroflexota bacterium]|nr:ATP-grasp domain-containing protein [Chloroflexota bacterium]
PLIELWVEARDGKPAVNPVMQALLADLNAAGMATTVRVPEHELIDPRRLLRGRQADLVLLKSATTVALSLAIADEAAGVRFLNSAQATVRAHDKAATVARLAAAGLPVPPTFLANEPVGNGLRPPGPWVVKPTRGVHGHGVTLHVDFAAALNALGAHERVHHYVVDDGTRLVQRQIGTDQQPDIKVYVAGEMIFAGAKRFSAKSYTEDRIVEEVLDDHTTAIVHAVGAALELRCFGVDLRFEDGEPYIIDANPFPGYRGFPRAVRALRSELERCLEARR